MLAVLTMLGITIGAPLPDPGQCDVVSLNQEAVAQGYTECWYRNKYGPAQGYLWMQRAGAPVEVILDKGKVRSFMIPTGGSAKQDEVYQMLEKKFGKPDQRKDAVFANTYGLKWTSIEAAWSMGEYVVTFNGAPNPIRGEITINPRPKTVSKGLD